MKKIYINQIQKELKIYTLSVVALCSLQLICNVLEPGKINLYFFFVPTSALYYVISFVISGIIVEEYGFKMAVKATYYNVISQIIFCGIAFVTLQFLKPTYTSYGVKVSQDYFFHFLSLELFGSLLSLVVSKVTTEYIVEKLRSFLILSPFWIRLTIATIIGEIVMLNIDYNITFFKSKNIHEIEFLVLGAMVYKTIAALLLSYPATIIKNIISKQVVLLKDNSTNKRYLKELIEVVIWKS